MQVYLSKVHLEIRLNNVGAGKQHNALFSMAAGGYLSLSLSLPV